MLGGFFMVHRKIQHWEWFKDPETLQLFLYLLCQANYKPGRFQGVEVMPGQVITGRKSICDATGLSDRSVRTRLNRLEKSQELTIQSTNRFSLITLTNWHKYQSQPCYSDQQTDQQPTSNRPATDQQPTTSNKEDKLRSKKPPTPLKGDCARGDLLEPQEQPKPKAKGRKKKAACAPEYSESFKDFWELYPRKENKVAAYESWKAIGESGRAKVSDIMAGLRAQLEHGSFSEDPKRRPHPSTWLNNARWEDEVSGNGSSPAAAWVKNADGVMVRREGQDWVDEKGYIQPGPEK